MLLVVQGEDDADAHVERPRNELARSLRDRIADRNDLESADLARLAALAARPTADDDDRIILDAEHRIAQAERAFSAFDYAGATTALSEALELLRPLARRATGRRRIAAVHLQLAMVLEVHGESGAAADEIRTCLHVDPDCAPDPARHPPELVELFRTTMAEPSTSSRVSIETTPNGAAVHLDGRAEATSPATWEDVPAGRHYVVIERDGFLPDVQVIHVVPPDALERTFVLTMGDQTARAGAALRALASDGVGTEPRWRREAAAITESDALFVLELGASPRLAAFDARGARMRDPLTLDPDDGGHARRYLDEALPPPTVPFYGQWWFWTPIALGAAILLAGATYLVVNVPDVQLIGGDVEFH